jgi:hypothetical protein
MMSAQERDHTRPARQAPLRRAFFKIGSVCGCHASRRITLSLIRRTSSAQIGSELFEPSIGVLDSH